MRKYISNEIYQNNYILNEHEKRLLKLEETFDKMQTNQKINTIFYNGPIYDAISILIDILNKAMSEIIIIDNYARKELLDILKNIKSKITIISKNIDDTLIKKYQSQYTNIEFKQLDIFHDRFIIIDRRILYNFGSSFKDFLYSYLSASDKSIVDSNPNFRLEDISMMHRLFFYNQDLEQESRVETMSDEELQELINSEDNLFTSDIDVKRIVKEAREQVNKKAIREYNKIVIFSTNMNLSEESLDIDLSKLDGKMISIFAEDNGVEKGRFIAFDPYASPEENYDVHLRHELRHSLTTSVSTNKDGIVIVKVGNNLFYYLDDNLNGEVLDEEILREIISKDNQGYHHS